MLGISKKHNNMDLERFINPRKTISKIFSQEVSTCKNNETVKNVIELMLKRYRRIPVVNNRNELKGIVTAVDVLDFLGGGIKHRIFARNRYNLSLLIEEIMNKDVHTLQKNITIAGALNFFRDKRKGGYPIIDKGKITGIISEFDFIKLIEGKINIPIDELMIRKPIITKEDYSILDVAKMMCRGGFRRLPVARDGILTGITTPYDIISYVNREKDLLRIKKDVKINEIMNTNIVSVTIDDTIGDAIEIMKKEGKGGLPVVDDYELVGIITEKDIIDTLVY